MNPLLFGILMFIMLFISIFLGHPLAFSLGGLAVIFGFIGIGPKAFLLFGNRIFDIINNYNLVAVPLFVLMANFLTQSGIGDGLFYSLRYVFGKLRGGLGIAVIVVSTIFAACTGVIGASVTTMGVLALPLLLKYGYRKDFSAGLICAGGTLGIIIAPSIMLVVMASEAGLSVGKLFLSSLFPGLLLSGLYIIYTIILCWLKPDVGPAISLEEIREIQKTPLGRRVFLILFNLIPPLILILGVLGSIFFGIATPTEASGVGAFLAFLMVLAYRRFSWKGLVDAVKDAGLISSMVFIILIGATCFTGVFIASGSANAVKELLLASGLGKWTIFFIMHLIIFVLGMFIDWMGIVMIALPMFLPVALDLGFDKLWFVTMIALNLQACFLTPPFGYALFYVKGVLPEGINTSDVWRGVWPFVGIIIFSLIMCTIFPELILWLPSL